MNNDMKSNVFSDENDIFNSGNSQSTVNSPNNNISSNQTMSNQVINSDVPNPGNNADNRSNNIAQNNGGIQATMSNQNNSSIPGTIVTPGTMSNQVNQVNQNTGNVPDNNQTQGTKETPNTNQIPVNNGPEMPKLNGDETIGMMKKDTQKSPVAILILFVALILSVFLIPQITPYFSDVLKIFHIDDNSSIYDNNRKDNPIENNTNKDQNDNNLNNDETKITYYDLKEDTEITFGDLKISNFLKTTESNNFYLSYKILNNGETSYSFRNHKIYFDFYNDSKTYLGRILIDMDTLASKEETTLKSPISETEYNQAISFEVLERTSADYQSVTLKNNKLTCTNSNHTIVYTFNSNNLVGLDDTFDYTFITNDDAYAKYSLDTQNTVNELNKSVGVSAGFVNKENGFIKTVRIDYSATEEDFTKYDRLYYLKNEKASTINYELESIGYKCD